MLTDLIWFSSLGNLRKAQSNVTSPGKCALLGPIFQANSMIVKWPLSNRLVLSLLSLLSNTLDETVLLPFARCCLPCITGLSGADILLDLFPQHPLQGLHKLECSESQWLLIWGQHNANSLERFFFMFLVKCSIPCFICFIECSNIWSLHLCFA